MARRASGRAAGRKVVRGGAIRARFWAMDAGEPRPRSYTVRRAAAIVFGLVAVLPLLLFAYTLYSLDALGKPQAQTGLGLALGLVLVGLYLFHGLANRMADLVRAAASPQPPSEAGGEPPEDGFHLPGLGTIREPEAIRESDMMPAAIDQLRAVWETEAQPYLGARVLVSVRNATEPVIGTLSQITGDGLLLLDEDGNRVGVSYRRISAIDPDRVPVERPRAT